MKMKTRKIVAKRFKVTKSGKIMHRRQNLRHLRSHKSKRTLRKYAKIIEISPNMRNAIRSMMPYN